MSQSNTATAVDRDKKRADRVRQNCGRFRILIIGRANAGKTSILQKVCNTTEQAEIFSSKGKKVRNL
jgi:GTP-binding protein EngB required for normal cell division